MKHGFDEIWVRDGLENVPEVRSFLAVCPTVPVQILGSASQVRVAGETMAEKIANGKRTLVIDRRSGSLLDEFVNHDTGAVCPNFPKIVASTNCPYGCQYCFLAGTYRACRPFICAYVADLVRLDRDIRRAFGASRRITVVSAGEMSDPLACDVLGYMPRIVRMFGGIENVKLLLLTKSGFDKIRPLLDVDHKGHTITAWSITCDEVVERYEPGNEPIADRLDAARAAQDAGFEVRVRLDPIMRFDGWQKAIERTVHDIYGRAIRPARFTLGSFRLLGNLRGIIKARFPESDILSQPLVNESGRRWRYPQETRQELYVHAIACIREYDDAVPVALCKETPEMHHSFAGVTDATKCNCLP